MFSIKYMMNYFLLLHIFQTTSVNKQTLVSMQDEGSLDSSSLKACQKEVSNWMLLYAMILQLKGWNLKQI